MADTLVYLIDTYTKAMDDHSPEFLDDARFVAKLGEGYEQISTLPTKKVKVGAKSVQATPMILRIKGAKNALSVTKSNQRAEDDEDDDADTGHQARTPRGMITALSGFADNLSKSISTALARSDGASHLGSCRDHSMPGLTIISGELASKAFDAGQIARDCGHPQGACPFPQGSVPATRWLQGYLAAGKVQKVDALALKRIRKDAKALAESLEEDEDATVSCPYRPGTETHAAWIKGFKEGGGRVE